MNSKTAFLGFVSILQLLSVSAFCPSLAPKKSTTMKLWDPKEEAEATLPEGWVEEVDERTGKLFYMNVFDGTKTFERPVIKPHYDVVMDEMGKQLEIECNPVTGDCYPV